MNARIATLRARFAVVLAGALLLTGMLSGPVHAAGAPGVGLLVQNWWGETMTLNIGSAEYHIPAYGSGFVPLAPGTYSLSANVNGRDDSSRDATITIPAGGAIQMTYFIRHLSFQTISITPPAAATAATPVPPANASPATAAPFDTAWHSIDAHQSLWYRVEIFSHDDSAFWLAMPNTLHSALTFEVYAGQDISRWWNQAPIGVGNVDGNGYNWGVTTSGSMVFYVRVINSGDQPSGFQFTYNGQLVTH